MKHPVPFDCAIAGKPVKIQPRAGQNLLEPGRPYVRCWERDCQYVDLNQPPCPLRADMFDESVDDSRALVEHLARHPGRRFCYACLSENLELTYAMLRRCSWQLINDVGAVIRPGRCVACRFRRLTIAIPPGHALDVLSRIPEAPSADVRPHEPPPADDCARVLAALQTLGGEASCATCVALAGELPLTDARRAMADLSSRGAVSVDLDGMCGVCARRQAVMTA